MSEFILTVEIASSQGAEDAARGMRELQDFINRPELGISGSREDVEGKPGQKGFALGALSIVFGKAVIGPLVDLLKVFVSRNRNLTIKIPTPDGELMLSGENVPVDQLIQLLQATAKIRNKR